MPARSVGVPTIFRRLLNSLCQFDILYCLLIITEGQTAIKNMYPGMTLHSQGSDHAVLPAESRQDIMASGTDKE